jgi:hypothetical protein
MGDAIVIIDIRLDGNVKLANRSDAVRNAKHSDVKKALERASGFRETRRVMGETSWQNIAY